MVAVRYSRALQKELIPLHLLFLSPTTSIDARIALCGSAPEHVFRPQFPVQVPTVMIPCPDCLPHSSYVILASVDISHRADHQRQQPRPRRLPRPVFSAGHLPRDAQLQRLLAARHLEAGLTFYHKNCNLPCAALPPFLLIYDWLIYLQAI
jgi:hypothetical protein